MSRVGGQVEKGKELFDKAGGALDAIIDNAEKMLACIQQVRASSEEQSSTTAHISENIETISRVTHSAVRGNQSVATSVVELSTLIEDSAAARGALPPRGKSGSRISPRSRRTSPRSTRNRAS
jgi:methyl-accepting chemotaxis protein